MVVSAAESISSSFSNSIQDCWRRWSCLITCRVFFLRQRPQCRFVRCNQAFRGLIAPHYSGNLLGRDERDFLPLAVAESLLVDDQRVMMHGPSVDQMWPWELPGSLQWFRCAKVPLYGAMHECVGLGCTMTPIPTPPHRMEQLGQLRPVLKFLEEHFREHIHLSELFRQYGLTPLYVQRLFRRVLQMLPSEYLLALRLREARHLLAATDEPLSSIALKSGFFDQSHLTKRFRAAMGKTPSQYRRALGAGIAVSHTSSDPVSDDYTAQDFIPQEIPQE